MEEKVILEVAATSNAGAKLAKTIFGQFMGALVLTDTRLMFLSIGKSGAGGQMARSLLFGAFGSLGRRSATRRAASNLDLSAMNNKGSWEVKLVNVRECEAAGSAWTNHYIRITGLDEKGQDVAYCCYGGDIKKRNKENIVAQILTSKEILLAKESG